MICIRRNENTNLYNNGPKPERREPRRFKFPTGENSEPKKIHITYISRLLKTLWKVETFYKKQLLFVRVLKAFYLFFLKVHNTKREMKNMDLIYDVDAWWNLSVCYRVLCTYVVLFCFHEFHFMRSIFLIY